MCTKPQKEDIFKRFTLAEPMHGAEKSSRRTESLFAMADLARLLASAASNGRRTGLECLSPSRISVSLTNLSAALGLLELIHANFCII